MKINQRQLRQIIKEELSRVTSEQVHQEPNKMILPLCYKTVDGKAVPDPGGTYMQDGVKKYCDNYLTPEENPPGPGTPRNDEDEQHLEKFLMPEVWHQILGSCLDEKD